MEHLQNLQAIADANGGTRASGTARLRRVARLRRRPARRRPATRRPCRRSTSRSSEELAPAVDASRWRRRRDLRQGDRLRDDDLLGLAATSPRRHAVDVADPAARRQPSSTSGCEAADFAGFPAGNIALIQRGTCHFGGKAANAAGGRRRAVVIFNEGQPGRTDAIAGTLGAPASRSRSSARASRSARSSTARAGTRPARRRPSTELRDAHDLERARRDRAGRRRQRRHGAAPTSTASSQGPGINDNGSGSGADPRGRRADGQGQAAANTVRFAWWGAEELGLLGSEHYVADLARTTEAWPTSPST